MKYELPDLPGDSPESLRIDKLVSSYYLTRKLQPVVLVDGKPYSIVQVDPYRVAYTWGARTANPMPGLEEVCKIKTLHRNNAPLIFKPSIAEVFAALVRERFDFNTIRAFLVRLNPADVPDWDAQEQAAMKAGFHLATTTLYK